MSNKELMVNRLFIFSIIVYQPNAVEAIDLTVIANSKTTVSVLAPGLFRPHD